MSWSLRLVNGDINVEGGGYDIVTGPEKMVQDLSCWILEPQGTDVMHLNYGSVLEDLLGSWLNAEQIMNIESEIRRIVMAYQAQQSDRRARDSVVYGGKNTLSTAEICSGIRQIIIEPVGDKAVCWVYLTSANGDQLAFTV